MTLYRWICGSCANIAAHEGEDTHRNVPTLPGECAVCGVRRDLVLVESGIAELAHRKLAAALHEARMKL